MEGMTQEGFPDRDGDAEVYEVVDGLTGEAHQITGEVHVRPIDTTPLDPMEPHLYGVGPEALGVIISSTPDTPPTE
jgi:hypothetical protein